MANPGVPGKQSCVVQRCLQAIPAHCSTPAGPQWLLHPRLNLITKARETSHPLWHPPSSSSK